MLKRSPENMETQQIEKVCILDDGRMAVFPTEKKAMYQHVYREAAEVYWDNEFGCFLSVPPQNWDCRAWYQQIIKVVRSGVGLDLLIDSEREFGAQLDGFEGEIRLADRELRG